MGLGDGHKADQAAVEAMRTEMDTVRMDGTIVIGEGERDEAPMLYIGEKVGGGRDKAARLLPAVDIAVDPLEGTNLCATGAPNAITVLAASESRRPAARSRPLHGKNRRRPRCSGAVELDAPVAHNLRAIAKRSDRDVEDLVIIVLDRPRHEKLIRDIRKTGARIRLISDGDLSAGISAAVMGIGRSRRDGHRRRARRRADRGRPALPQRPDLAGWWSRSPSMTNGWRRWAIKDPKRIYDTADLAPGKNIIFACTGVTDGELLRGVRFFGDGTRTSFADHDSRTAPGPLHRLRAPGKGPGRKGPRHLASGRRIRAETPTAGLRIDPRPAEFDFAL